MGLRAGLARFLHRADGLPLRGARALRRQLERVDRLGEPLRDVTDAELRLRADALAGRVRDRGVPDPAAVDEGFAIVREVAARVLGQRLHDAQVLAGLALHEGSVAELATGEGKTLAAVAPAWLGALGGRGVHVLTFNDYLARRDAAWMGPVYERLGATVGCVQEGMDAHARRRAWAADVTYSTAKQAGFDFLRDQRALHPEDAVHRPFHQAIVDEADSLMIDEARVPLVLSGEPAPPAVDARELADLVARLHPEADFVVDENARNVALTERGVERVEARLGVVLHEEGCRDVHAAVNQALHARALLHRDVDYIVRDGEVEVIDAFTGRVVADRRWPDGLHPALEAKEGLAVRPEGRVLASISLQHFFALYPKLSGMTATAAVAAEELNAFYGIGVTEIPPHRRSRRRDAETAVFTDRASKRRAVVDEVRRVHGGGRPVLVGTASVAESEELASSLLEAGIACRVLNAKNDEEEAALVAEAGRPGAVTISTNMAGRGTDIRLGGSSEGERERVVASGGLHVVGTNLHESRRIDDQLRGRAGRQGEPGSSRFFLSLEDDLVVRYGLRDVVQPYVAHRGPGPVDDPRAAAEIERAQRIVDGQNFDIRHLLWRYTSMVEQQRQVVKHLRDRALHRPDTLDRLQELRPERWAELVSRHGPMVADAVQQRLTLLCVDEAWAAHLARLAEEREGIHLHQLTGHDWFGGLWAMRKTPLDVFHEVAVAAFEETEAEIEAGLLARFDALDLTAERIDLEAGDLRGTRSTWTHVVNDTPFASTIVRAYRALRPRRG